jgi:hypothetical protein
MQTDLDAQNVPETPPDRRRHPRFRLSVPLTIRCADGATIQAISMEVSESGLSAITAQSLNIGDTVELEPIVASKLSAVVRQNVGKVHGFEFLNLTSEQAYRIRERCKMLPRYRGKLLGI